MELHVKRLEYSTIGLKNEPLKITYLDDTSYVTRTGCPICAMPETQALSQIRTKNQKGLEVHFCSECEHIFFKRHPDAAWYTAYYEAQQDVNITQSISFTRRLKRYVRNKPFVQNLWWRRLRKRHRSADAICTMLREAVTDANLLYFNRLDIQKVLEIGCGFGETLHLFRGMGMSPVGIDASPKRIAVCRAEGLNAFEVPLSDLSVVGNLGPFDLITSSHVLEHILDLDQHLTQISELVHDGTCLHFEVPNASQEHVFYRGYDPVHLHVFSLRSLGCLLSKYGFTIIRVIQDQNTHVLAIRSNKVSSSFGYRESEIVALYERGLSELRENIGQTVRINYIGTYGPTITNLTTGEEIYRHNIGFSIKDLPASSQHTLEGVLQQHQGKGPRPLVFRHSGDQAPVATFSR